MNTEKNIKITLSTHKTNKYKTITFESNKPDFKDINSILRTKKMFNINPTECVDIQYQDNYYYYFFDDVDTANEIIEDYKNIRGYKTIKLYESESIEIDFSTDDDDIDVINEEFIRTDTDSKYIYTSDFIMEQKQADKDINDYITKLSNVDVEPIVEKIINELNQKITKKKKMKKLKIVKMNEETDSIEKVFFDSDIRKIIFDMKKDLLEKEKPDTLILETREGNKKEILTNVYDKKKVGLFLYKLQVKVNFSKRDNNITDDFKSRYKFVYCDSYCGGLNIYDLYFTNWDDMINAYDSPFIQQFCCLIKKSSENDEMIDLHISFGDKKPYCRNYHNGKNWVYKKQINK
tara:strand:- start:43 stop:1086 length:1044 start_codon:yes stop_codon:yes gene_type:complete